MTTQVLRDALSSPWLEQALAEAASTPAAVHQSFPAAARNVGRGPLIEAPGWTRDAAARAVLLAVLPPGEVRDTTVTLLYRRGDSAEKCAILKALPLLAVGRAGTPLVEDALRTNDTRLVAAAVGPCAEHLDQAAWRHAVLKCVFLEIPLASVHGLRQRADGRLAEMLADLADERLAAGRGFPADAADLYDLLTLAPEA
jgi:hypothetical protein